MIAELIKRYQRSAASSRAYEARAAEGPGLVAGLLAADPHLQLEAGARNPMVTADDMEVVEHDGAAMTAADRFATHLSTMVLSQHPDGQEVQAAARHDGAGLSLASNLNAVNTQLRGQLKVATDVKELAAKVLASRKVSAMTREAAMDDVVVRHTLKLYQRIQEILAPDAAIDVPASVAVKLDGQHAEIRIQQSPLWDEATHHVPAGTKYPCMGCYLYFNGQAIEIGRWFGPLWLTMRGPRGSGRV